jgi:peptidoglycan/LPS O-acetylase OafA/YrhL
MKIASAALALARCIAVFIVVLFHNQHGSAILSKIPALFTAGPQMVTFFFVLSGFVLGLSYIEREKYSKRIYFIKRLARILPVYLFALLLCVGIDIYRGNFDYIPLLLNIFLIQAWIPSYALSINAPGWFLSNLMFFYLLFPFVLYIFKKISTTKIATFTLVFWLCTQGILLLLLNSSFYTGFPSASHDLIFYFPLAHLCSFLLGVAGASIFLSRKKNVQKSTFIFLIAFWILSLLFLLEYQQIFTSWLGLHIPYQASFYAPIFLLFIFTLCLPHAPIVSQKKSDRMLFLEEISFSLYILQEPIEVFVECLIQPSNQDIFIAVYLPVLFAISYFVFSFIEKPINHFVQFHAQKYTAPCSG